MRKIWVLVVLAGCSAYPKVDWPGGDMGYAPDLLPLDEVLGEAPGSAEATKDRSGAALAAQAAGLKARVAERP